MSNDLENYIQEVFQTYSLTSEQMEFILMIAQEYSDGYTLLKEYNLEEIIAAIKSVINLDEEI